MSEDPSEMVLPVSIHDAMVAHCVREAPLEACGILGGVGSNVFSFHPLTNLSSTESHYQDDTRELIDAVRTIREGGGEMLAIYHSHPKWEAIPSQTDLRENYYELLPRVIVSLLGATPEVRIWASAVKVSGSTA